MSPKKKKKKYLSGKESLEGEGSNHVQKFVAGGFWILLLHFLYVQSLTCKEE